MFDELKIYYLLLLAGAIIGLKKVNKNSLDFFIVMLTILGFVEEFTCYCYQRLYGNNMVIFHIAAPLEFLIICLYYNYTIAYFRKKKFGFWIGLSGILFSVINSLFIQDLKSFPSVFLLFESFCIIGLSMFSYFTLFRQEDIVLSKNAQFWITSLFLLFWSFTFLIWGTKNAFIGGTAQIKKWTFLLLYTINMIYYGGFIVVFLRYKKLIPSGEQ